MTSASKAKLHPSRTRHRLLTTLNRVLDINGVVFAPLVVLAIGTAMIEAATYRGFMLKNTDVSPVFFLVLAVTSYTAIVVRKLLYGVNFKPEAKLILRINILCLPLALFLLSSLWKIEAENFPNYVFSTYHLNLDILQSVLSLSFFLAVPYLMTEYLLVKPLKSPVAKLPWYNLHFWAPIVFVCSIIVMSAVQLDRIFLRLGKDVVAILSSPTSTFEDRQRQQVGPIFDVYKFFNAHTEPQSVIMVAPQSESGTVGNIGYTRYFMYPRYLIHREDFPPDQVPETDYILIMRSGFDAAQNKVVVWPRYPVPAESIFLFNEETHEVTRLDGVDYSPDDARFYDRWGVIKIDKSRY